MVSTVHKTLPNPTMASTKSSLLFLQNPSPVPPVESSAVVNEFPGIGTLLAFVHTKIDYRTLHIDNKELHGSMKDKKEKLRGLTQSSPPIFIINSISDLERPVQYATTLNTIRDILLAAVRSKLKYSVLVLGKTQSGKSRLIQHIKNYADATHNIDLSNFGNDNESKKESAVQFFSTLISLPTKFSRLVLTPHSILKI